MGGSHVRHSPVTAFGTPSVSAPAASTIHPKPAIFRFSPPEHPSITPAAFGSSGTAALVSCSSGLDVSDRMSSRSPIVIDMVDGEEGFSLPSCLDPRTSSGPNDLLPTRASSERATAPLVIEPSSTATLKHGGGFEAFVHLGQDFYAGNVGSAPAPPKGGYISTKPGVVVTELEQAIFNEPLEMVTGPIKTVHGYHLLWIKKRLLIS